MNISAQPMYQLNPCIKACMAAELAGSVQVLQSEKPQSLIYQWMIDIISSMSSYVMVNVHSS